MKQQPQEPDRRLCEASGGSGDLQDDELESLLKLLIDLKLVDQPQPIDLEPLEAPDRQFLEESGGLKSDELPIVPTVAVALLLPDDTNLNSPSYSSVCRDVTCNVPTDGATDRICHEIDLNRSDEPNRSLKQPPSLPGNVQHCEPEHPEHSSETAIDAFATLQSLLVGAELSAARTVTATLEQKLARLEHQLYEPAALMSLLQPWVAELLVRKVAESREEVVQAIAPIIDQAIECRGTQDKVSMSAAISPLIAAALSQQTNHSPEEVANAIAPTIGRAIKEQIRLEQDVMVDALYPIIGSTIAKYMAEAIQSINQQIENTLSPEGIRRKIRAKLQGVSEAELILKQALPFTVQAIFLIHKASGLLIAEIQPAADQSLESELLAGMLTAIRSFANDCMVQAGTTSELDQIDYGGAKIILEVAGYCYLAVVVQGNPPRSFMVKLRQTLSTLVKQYGNQLETFDGDPDTIPAAVPTSLEALRNHFAGDRSTQAAKPPFLLLGAVGLLALIGIPWGIYHYHQTVVRQAESKAALALASTPALAVYRLDVTAQHGTLALTGRLPNPVLRQQAEQVARRAVPDWALDNEIVAVEVPPDPTLAAAEVKRVTRFLNQTDGTAITTRYTDGRVLVDGYLNQTIAASTMTQAFAQIPGVRSVTNTVSVVPMQIPIRVYFQPESATLEPADKGYKIKQVIAFLQQYPNQQLHLIGHSDRLDGADDEQTLALQRAVAVRDALVSQGADSSRLQVVEAALAPDPTASLAWQRRYVSFESIVPTTHR